MWHITKTTSSFDYNLQKHLSEYHQYQAHRMFSKTEKVPVNYVRFYSKVPIFKNHIF